MIEIVIKIPDELYNHAKDVYNRTLTPNEENVIRDSIADGTPLTERSKGKWIHWTDDYKDYCTCSECGYGEEGEVLLKDKTPYCPYCGSYNGGIEDENNPGC